MESVIGGPEVLFRVHEIGGLGESGASAWMDLGAWSAGADGRTALGALGVLADDALGYAIVRHPARPNDHWSVSSEITIDALDDPPAAGPVQAVAEARYADAAGAIATGELRDAAGRPFALIAQRARWVPLSSGRHPLAPHDAFSAPENAGPAELLGVRGDEGGLFFGVAEILRNPAGALHGGVSLTAAAVAAERALDDGGPALRIRGIRIAYPRPTHAGDRVELRAHVISRGRTTGLVDVDSVVEGRARTHARVTAEA